MVYAAIVVGSVLFVAAMSLLLRGRAPWRLIMLLPAAIVLAGAAAIFVVQGWALWQALLIAAVFGGWFYASMLLLWRFLGPLVAQRGWRW